MFLRELKYSEKKKKIISTVQEEAKLNESDNEFDKYQNIYDGLH